MERESVGPRESDRLRREQRESERVNELRREKEWNEERKRERKKATEQVTKMMSVSRSDSGDESGESESEAGEGSVCESENLMAWGETGEGERGGRSGIDWDRVLEPLRNPKKQRDRAEGNREVTRAGEEKEKGNGRGGMSEESKNEGMKETHNTETHVSPLPSSDSNHVLTQVTAHTLTNQNKPKDQSEFFGEPPGSRSGADAARAAVGEAAFDTTPHPRSDRQAVTCGKQDQDSVSLVEGERERKDRDGEGDGADALNVRATGSRQTTLHETVRIHGRNTALTDGEEGGRAGGEEGEKGGQRKTNKTSRAHTCSTKAPGKTTSSTRTNSATKKGKGKK